MKEKFLKRIYPALMVVLLFAIVSGYNPAISQENSERDIFIPGTISEEAKVVLKKLIEAKPYLRVVPAPDAVETWKKTYQAVENQNNARSQAAIEMNKVTVKELELGGVPVLDIRPESWADNGKVLVYTHGGAYVIFSARSTLPSSAPMCKSTGLRVISIDYTLAPHANWREIQEQVMNVFKALLKEGYSMNDIAIYGDSAGGGLAISTVLNLREAGMGMPAAIVLLSPWADISDAGDSAVTLRDADPTLSYENLLKNSALAFADGLSLTDPRVSPLYADFSKGFPPALITEGTKCILFSTSVSLYQALEMANQSVKLDMYEGMWHVFQQAPMPESEVAIRKAAEFINSHLE